MNVNQQKPPISILLADDDLDDRNFFDKALRELTIAATLNTVNNGEQLMEYLTANADLLPDVLFLDLSMPRKTGFECLSEIKENEKLKKLMVIMFTTSFTRDIDLEINLKDTLCKMGAEDYIRKPADFNEFKLVVHQALNYIAVKKENP